MLPHGTLYQSGGDLQGEFRIALTEKERKHFKLIRFFGANLSSLALAFTIFFYGPTFELDLDYQAGLARVNASQQSPANNKGINESVTSQRSSIVDSQFSLSIPAIGATANIIRNIDPYDETVYTNALKKGIAHAAGTALPGEGGRIYLFAHSTNSPTNFGEYNAIFYQLRLLKEGDRIFINHNGESHLFIVKEKVIVDANDTHWLTEKGSKEELVLQTCDPPGTTLRRLLIIAEPAPAL